MSKLTDPIILPFYALAGVYILSQQTSGFWSSHPVIPVLLKIAPIWYLVAYTSNFLFFNKPRSARLPKSKLTNGKPSSGRTSSGDVETSYTNFVTSGLVFSSIGDILMSQKTQLISGGAVFGIAHVLYLLAFRKRGAKKGIYSYLATPVFVVGGYTIASMAPSEYVIFAILYNLMIGVTVITALCCYEQNRESSSLYAAVGGFLFYISDYIIGYDLFIAPIPNSHTVVMVTYYSAQLLLALSVNKI